MATPQKLKFSICIYAGVSAVVFAIIYMLNINKIISADDKLLNGIIYGACALTCIIAYIYIYQSTYKKCCDKIEEYDCILPVVAYVLFFAPSILFGLSLEGVHLAICAICGANILSLAIYTIIAYLRNVNSLNYFPNPKYTVLISAMKIWINFVYCGMYFFGAAIVIFPHEFFSLL